MMGIRYRYRIDFPTRLTRDHRKFPEKPFIRNRTAVDASPYRLGQRKARSVARMVGGKKKKETRAVNQWQVDQSHKREVAGRSAEKRNHYLICHFSEQTRTEQNQKMERAGFVSIVLLR